jgi:cytochrome c
VRSTDRALLLLCPSLFLAAGMSSSPAQDDFAKGERVFQYCYACHSVEPGETDLEGPNLRSIVGRRVAALEGFDYSPALRELAAREPLWTEALLERFIADPRSLAPRTRMAFPGLRDSDERQALVTFLKAVGQRR